jgi:hypothetical protein
MTKQKQRSYRNRPGQSRGGQPSSRNRQAGNGQAAPRNSSSASRQAAARRRQRTKWNSGLLAVAAVVIVAVVFVVVKVTDGSSPSTASSSAATSSVGTSPLAASVETAVTHVPKAVLDTVGAQSGLGAPQAVTNKAKLLTANGKPSVVFIGAEYCPYCATERWPLTIALSRFGTFTGLQATHSSSSDVYPSTQTLSYYGASYTSPYINFTSVEMQTNQPDGSSYTTLQTPTTAEENLLDTYDTAPYTTQPGSIPFVDFGNRYILSGASYNPQILQGKSASEIANALSDPTSEIAAGADGTANLLTAALCKITSGKPQTVCADPTITSAARQLK